MQKSLIRPFFVFFCGLLSSAAITAQSPTVQLITSGTKTNLRGLSVVNDNIIWVSGSNGTIGRSVNSGKNWTWMTVKGFETKEFRDIEAFDASTAIIMAIDSPAYILKTVDGGDTWKVVYENKSSGMFLDAMDFSDYSNGIVVGDPIGNQIFLAYTNDNGSTWKEIPATGERPAAEPGEAFFAASGTNLRVFRDGTYFLASGGTRSRIITKNSSIPMPMIQGRETTGANSLDIYDNGSPSKAGRRMIVVGGDFNNSKASDSNCVYTTNGGKTWKVPKKPPHGYRSCVEYLSTKDIIACGLTGVDYSEDGGKSWKLISDESYNTCRIARNGSAFFLVGSGGKVGKVNWD